ncbi:nascent polypeptide-associated complex subunit alpha, muscle-specific form-like [Choloepus didactylus]|uniref:nascent polypeptide-associated complex subunit alpha, muscle-specific form-like n=1 Tax=Choloepus didactylus TaxID=27675 RepID=UPI0018A0FEAF|nr:nascent polypeptide-associated complex subunit alpha, muscle-specific form-like [Choloepus didactylus]
MRGHPPASGDKREDTGAQGWPQGLVLRPRHEGALCGRGHLWGQEGSGIAERSQGWANPTQTTAPLPAAPLPAAAGTPPSRLQGGAHTATPSRVPGLGADTVERPGGGAGQAGGGPQAQLVPQPRCCAPLFLCIFTQEGTPDSHISVTGSGSPGASTPPTRGSRHPPRTPSWTSSTAPRRVLPLPCLAQVIPALRPLPEPRAARPLPGQMPPATPSPAHWLQGPQSHSHLPDSITTLGCVPDSCPVCVLQRGRRCPLTWGSAALLPIANPRHPRGGQWWPRGACLSWEPRPQARPAPAPRRFWQGPRKGTLQV